MEELICDLCKMDQTDVMYSGSDFHLPDLPNINFVRCQVCGLMYLKPRPD